MKKRKNKNGKWSIPENAADYFELHYDDKFKAEHPILYLMTIIAIIILTLVGPVVYFVFVNKIQSEFDTPIELITMIVGCISSYGISIGTCNLFMIVHKQYLGHYVTLISFAIGIGGSALSLMLLWIYSL